MTTTEKPQLSYKGEITRAMETLAQDQRTRFIGYGLKTGKALGTLGGVRPEQIVETTVAENLMVGMAIGMSMAGLRPVVYIERLDFIMNAMDALVNHLDKIDRESGGEFSPAIIIRATVGNKLKPLFTGSTHTGDYFDALAQMFANVTVSRLDNPEFIANYYAVAADEVEIGKSSLLIEYKDKF